MKNTGNGFLLEFPSIVGALECAMAVQALMAERNSQLPADRVMQFRLGVHMGDVMADEDEVFGDGVNVAVRERPRPTFTTDRCLLYWMLKPASERPRQFCMGARDFDPEHVGFRLNAGEAASCQTGETLFSMTGSDGKEIKGNSVLGHSLEGTPGPGKNGVIGRTLTEDERFDLIEYLKTL